MSSGPDDEPREGETVIRQDCPVLQVRQLTPDGSAVDVHFRDVALGHHAAALKQADCPAGLWPPVPGDLAMVERTDAGHWKILKISRPGSA